MFRIGTIQFALLDKPMNTRDLAEAVFLSPSTVRHYIKFLHEQRLVRVSRWERRKVGRQAPVAVYAWGAGPDAQQPENWDSTQRQAAHRKRVKADPDMYEMALAKNRAWKRAKRATKKPQTWASALGVSA
jgi:predicted ArsR family transcriptional regulator